MLAEQYYKKTGDGLTVFPVYYGRKKKKIVVGKPLYIQPMVKVGFDRTQIADRCMCEVNKLYRDNFKDN